MYNALVHAVGGVRPGAFAVVHGAGPIGLASVALLRACGAARVTDRALLDECSRAEQKHQRLPDLVADGVRQARDVTLAFVVTGGRIEPDDLRRAATRVPRHARTTVVQAKPNHPKRLAPGTPVTELIVGSLGELRGLLSLGERS